MLNEGVDMLDDINRGLSKFGDTVYRNNPEWQIPLALQREMPGIQIITDASHIAGNRENLYQVSQSALNLNLEGLMLETHCTPDDAWRDAAQHVTPEMLKTEILDKLVVLNEEGDEPVIKHNIMDLRSQSDLIDK